MKIEIKTRLQSVEINSIQCDKLWVGMPKNEQYGLYFTRPYNAERLSLYRVTENGVLYVGHSIMRNFPGDTVSDFKYVTSLTVGVE